MRRLALYLTLTGLWLTALPARAAAQATAAARRLTRDDRGESPLTMAVIALGTIAMAIAVVAILRAKAEGAANSICTSTDGTTCR
ncbi:hypothetical protein [Pseudofrankia sp. DC12]|uniref:hypothetical protein n=1 Tax=Pseudofrankia sp. DC12 TaxID=683315 RepID=UPI0005F86C59|nr:hypothetical protein [Pseudofrankia sp. DC12]